MSEEDAIAEYRKGLDYYAVQGEKRHESLESAVASFEKALQFYNATNFPQEWARIQEIMTNAYGELVQERITNNTQLLVAAKPPPKKPSFSHSQRVMFGVLILCILLFPAGAFAHSYLSLNSTNCVAGTLNIDGSTALQPLVEAAAKSYMQQCSGATIIVGGGASKKGLADVEQGEGVMVGVDAKQGSASTGDQPAPIQIGDSDIFASPTQSDLVDHQIAIVVFAVILNKSVTGIHNLSTSQLQRIYSGVYDNWKQVCDGKSCGPDLSIVATSRTTNSGTRFTFEKYVLNGVATVPGLGLERTTAPQAVQEVTQVSGSIGYAPLRLALQAPALTVISIDGQNPTNSALVENNTYKFWNIEHMYTKGAGTPLAQAFLRYMYSDTARQQARQLGYLSLTDVPQSIRLSHQLEAR